MRIKSSYKKAAIPNVLSKIVLLYATLLPKWIKEKEVDTIIRKRVVVNGNLEKTEVKLFFKVKIK